MPVTSFNKKLLFRILGYDLDDKALEAQIVKMGLTVEESGNDEITLEFPSNRPDLLGTVGFARALKNFMHRSKKFVYTLQSQNPALDINVGKSVSRIRPFIAGLVVKNLTLDEESLKDVINFTEKLCETYGRNRAKIAIGLHNLDKIKAPLQYDAYGDEEFVPLNGTKPMKFSAVMAEHEKGQQYGHITKSKSKEKYVALKDAEGTLALIPILNCERTKVTASTKNLFVDVTGTTMDTIDKTADILACMFLDLGGDVRPVNIIDGDETEKTPMMSSKQIEIPLLQAEKEIGVAIGFNNALSLANKMGYEGALVGKELRLNVPAYRADVLNEQDVIEDIAIAYGYDFIQPLAVPSAQDGILEPNTLASRKIARSMVGLGFVESVNSFISNEKANFTDMRLPVPKDYIRIKNSKTIALTMMRTWLLPSLLRNIAMSKNERMPQRMFEVDLAFNIEGNAVYETHHLSAVETGPKANFNDVKAYFAGLNSLMTADLKLEEAKHGSFIDGRCAKITVGNRTVGYMGELHPEVLANFGIEEPTIAMEIDLTGIEF